MAVINVNKEEFLHLVGKKISNKEIEDAVNALGMDLEKIEGNEITVDITANRPDLLSQSGLAGAVSSFLDIKKGLRKYEVRKSKYAVNIENAFGRWPYVACAVVKGAILDDERIKEIIQLQEKLGATFLRNRKKGGIGLYPLKNIKFPVRYTCETPEKIKFRPLGFSKPATAFEILETHPTGREYADIMSSWEKFPVFLDAAEKIMSMPPIINSEDMGRVMEDTREVFIETTGTDFRTINYALNIVVSSLVDMGGKVYSVKLLKGKKTIETPDFNPEEMKFDINYINRLLGLNMNEAVLRKLFLRMGYGIKNKNTVLVPALRTDIMHQTDLAEDAAVAYGYENLKEEIPEVFTIAEENKLEIFKKKIAEIMCGLGLLEVHSYNLTSRINQAEKMHTAVKCVELANAINEEYNVLRAWVIPSLLNILSGNKHNEYPQNLFEIGDVFKYNDSRESGVEEFVRLGVCKCHNGVSFTDIKQVLDSLMHALDLNYEIKDAEHNSFIPGRVGRISARGTDIAYIGEIHPQVLSEFNLELPVVVLELNLSELFRIV